MYTIILARVSSLLITRLHDNDPTLTELDLSGQPEEHSDMKSEMIEAIANIMKWNAHFSERDLSDNKLNDEDACYLATGLLYNETLKSHDLTHTQITPKSFEVLSKLILSHTTLIDLKYDEAAI